MPQNVAIEQIKTKAAFTSETILKHEPNEDCIMNNRKHFNINDIYNKN